GVTGPRPDPVGEVEQVPLVGAVSAGDDHADAVDLLAALAELGGLLRLLAALELGQARLELGDSLGGLAGPGDRIAGAEQRRGLVERRASSAEPVDRGRPGQ